MGWAVVNPWSFHGSIDTDSKSLVKLLSLVCIRTHSVHSKVLRFFIFTDADPLTDKPVPLSLYDVKVLVYTWIVEKIGVGPATKFLGTLSLKTLVCHTSFPQQPCLMKGRLGTFSINFVRFQQFKTGCRDNETPCSAYL